MDKPIAQNMDLGAFSVSLAVKDIEASKLFYQNLGFTVFMGSRMADYEEWLPRDWTLSRHV
jgi:hypothetical protein